MIGIIGAMDQEVDELKSMMTDTEITSKAGLDFCKGILEGKEVVIVKCGVGKVNAAICTEALIETYHPDCVINTGVAGGLDADINIGDIVLSTDALEHDMDVRALGYERGVIPDQEESVYVADEGLRNKAFEVCKKVNPDIQVFMGRVVSGDQFISGKEKKDDLVGTFAAACAEMEGASIAHTAGQNKVPFLIVRSISDKADDSAHMDYPEFLKIAVKNSVRMMTELVREL